MGASESFQIATERLDLVLLGRGLLEHFAGRQRATELPFLDPAGFLAGAEDVVQLRLDQLEANPAVGPWLLRALVLRDSRVAVGFIGFHAGPNERGVVEIGYEVLPGFRRRGYAHEAVTALTAWAAREGARIVRASVSPDNAASLAMVARLGFVLVGEQLDEVDGRELVFEKPVA